MDKACQEIFKVMREIRIRMFIGLFEEGIVFAVEKVNNVSLTIPEIFQQLFPACCLQFVIRSPIPSFVHFESPWISLQSA